MLHFALDGLTSFSSVPLRMATWLGVLAGIVATGVGIWALYAKFWANRVVPGWTTIMILVAFSASIQLVMMGILGEYIGRIYNEIKQRPLYVLSEQINLPGSNVSRRPF